MPVDAHLAQNSHSSANSDSRNCCDSRGLKCQSPHGKVTPLRVVPSAFNTGAVVPPRGSVGASRRQPHSRRAWPGCVFPPLVTPCGQQEGTTKKSTQVPCLCRPFSTESYEGTACLQFWQHPEFLSRLKPPLLAFSLCIFSFCVALVGSLHTETHTYSEESRDRPQTIPRRASTTQVTTAGRVCRG